MFNHYQVKFSKAFPSPKTHSYFMFMDSLSYHDKLLDAFETRYIPSCLHDHMIINNYCFRFGDKIQEGIDYVESYCKNNAHIWVKALFHHMYNFLGFNPIKSSSVIRDLLLIFLTSVKCFLCVFLFRLCSRTVSVTI